MGLGVVYVLFLTKHFFILTYLFTNLEFFHERLTPPPPYQQP